MSLKPIQEDVEQWIRSHTDGYFPPLLMLARLTEELGELSRAVSHEFTIKKPKPGEAKGDIEGEIGDLLFVLVCLANSLDIELDTAWKRTLEKLYVRDATRWK